MKKNLWVLTTIAQLCIVVFSIDAFPATLFEANWNVGTTCNETTLKSGVWTGMGGVGPGDCLNPCNCWTIGTGGEGGRNYLSIIMPRDGSGRINGHIPFGNPATVFVRFWFRMLQYVNSQHPLYLNSSTSPSAGVCLIRGFVQTFSIIPGTAKIYYPTFDINLNQWYLLEFKITGGGTSNGTIIMKLDGVDITANTTNYVDGHSLATDNGSFTMPAINYINIESYDKSGEYLGSWLHLTGLKITDGPTWIDGGEEPSPPRNLHILNK